MLKNKVHKYCIFIFFNCKYFIVFFKRKIHIIEKKRDIHRPFFTENESKKPKAWGYIRKQKRNFFIRQKAPVMGFFCYFFINFNTSIETLISFLIIGLNNCNQEKLRHLDNATYICHLSKAPQPVSITTWSKLFPCALWLVIAKAILTGNCLYVPTTIGSSNSSTQSVFLQTFFRSSISPPSSKTTIKEETKSQDFFICVIVPRVPFIYCLSRLSLMVIIILAHTLSFKYFSTGRSSPSKSPFSIQ